MSTLRVSNIEAKADASSPSVNEKVKITNSNGDVLVTVNGETAGITTIFTTLSLGTGTSISSPATNVLTLGTNNAERVRVSSAGSFAIGTDNPSHKLDVVGNTQLYGTVIVGDNTDISPTASGAGQFSIDADGYTPYIAADATAMHIGHNSSLRDLKLQTNETDRLTINGSTGKIGIGTTNTDRILAVYGVGNLGTQLAIESPDTNAAGLSIDGDRRYEIQSTSTVYTHPSSLIFYDRDADALRMKIDENGRVSRPYQLWIAGSPTNTTGSGIFNTFDTSDFASPVGLAFSTDRITVPIDGVYLITFCSIIDNVTTREDTTIRINGSIIVATLNTPSTSNGYHYRGASISVKLSANDYIQFESDDWYSPTTTNYWKTASVYLLG